MRDDSNLINNIIYPEKFNTDFVYTYTGFDSELKGMIERSGYKTEFVRKYRSGLIQLVDLKTNCIALRNRFEKLRNAENLYSMRLPGEKKHTYPIHLQKMFKQNSSCPSLSFRRKGHKKQ